MVGDSLFERGSRGVALTRRGGELIVNARRIVSLLDETAASMAAPPLGGPVRIGIPEEYGHAILSRALGAFSKRHPRSRSPCAMRIRARRSRRSPPANSISAVVFEWQDLSGGEVLMHDPTVWVTSNLHHMHEERPVPIALYNRAGWCKRLRHQVAGAARPGLPRRLYQRHQRRLEACRHLRTGDRADLAQQYPGRLPRADRPPTGSATSIPPTSCCTAIRTLRARRSTACKKRSARRSSTGRARADLPNFTDEESATAPIIPGKRHAFRENRLHFSWHCVVETVARSEELGVGCRTDPIDRDLLCGVARASSRPDPGSCRHHDGRYVRWPPVTISLAR